MANKHHVEQLYQWQPDCFHLHVMFHAIILLQCVSPYKNKHGRNIVTKCFDLKANNIINNQTVFNLRFRFFNDASTHFNFIIHVAQTPTFWSGGCLLGPWNVIWFLFNWFNRTILWSITWAKDQSSLDLQHWHIHSHFITNTMASYRGGKREDIPTT